MGNPKTVTSEVREIKNKCRAIVMFGHATPTSGFRPAEYFQVTIDPDMVSPSGEFIRFGVAPGDEINGWQRVEALTICEVLGEYQGEDYPPNTQPPNESVSFRVVSG